jgi:PAS domain S-box-containing protein
MDEMKIMETGNSILNFEEKAVFKETNDEFWFSTSRMPLYNPEGQIVGTFGISKNITEQKQMEMELKLQNEELAAQEEELRQHLEEMSLLKEDLQNEKKLLDTLLENIPDGLYFKNINSKYTRISNSMLFLFNEKETKKVIGKSEFDYLGENAKVHLDLERQVIASGLPVIDHEIKEERLNGITHWLSATKLPLKNIHGQIIGIFGISKNISKIKKLELAAIQQKEFFENILDKLPNKVFVKDHECKMIFVNSEVAKAHGTTREKLLGLSDFDFFEATKARLLFNEEQEIMKNGAKSMINNDTLSGKDMILQTVKMPLFLPQIGKVGLLGIQHDITEIKRLEEAANQQAEELMAQEEELRQNLEELQVIQEDLIRKNEDNERIKANLARESSLLEALLSTLPESIYFKDKESKFIRCSNKMAQNFGLKEASELIGKSDFDYLSYSIAEEAFNIEQKIMRTAQGIINKEERDSFIEEEHWLSTTKMPLMLEDKIIGTFGITRDITDIKRAQIEAREQAKELRSINDEQEKAQKELRWERQMFQTLMAALTSHITFKDLTGKYVRINKAKSDKLGIASEDEAIGKSDVDFFDRKLSMKQREIEEQVIKTRQGYSNFVNKIEFPNGEIYWGDSSILPIKDTDGEIIGILDLTKGITKLKEAELIVYEQNYKIEGLTQKTPIIVFRINKLGRFTELKGKATELFQIPHDKLTGMSVFDLFPNIAATIHEGLGENEFIFSKKYNKDGNEIEIEFVFRENPEIEKSYFGYAYQKSGMYIKEYDEIEKVKNTIKNLKKK